MVAVRVYDENLDKVLKVVQEQAARQGRGLLMIYRLFHKDEAMGYGFALIVSERQEIASLHGRTKKGKLESLVYTPGFEPFRARHEAFIMGYLRKTARAFGDREEELLARMVKLNLSFDGRNPPWQPLWNMLARDADDLPLGNMPAEMREQVKTCILTHVEENRSAA